MNLQYINGHDFMNMVLSGAARLYKNQEKVNELNVFPVPDGDTGTNMNRTMESGSAQMKQKGTEHIGTSAESLSKGLLMGARGNSGVILSQLFRGFSKSISQYEHITPEQFANALKNGVDTAYQAVIKPVEGTILTVAKDAAVEAVKRATDTNDMLTLMELVLAEAYRSLANTPNLLPILKQVGVVDSGGQGLVYIYEGFVEVLRGNIQGDTDFSNFKQTVSPDVREGTVQLQNAQSQIQTDDIEHFYDMEFFILRSQNSVNQDYSQHELSDKLNQLGDSVIVIEDDDIIKVHVHSKSPGEVLNYVIQFGELSQIHIQNMKDQHRDIIGSYELDPYGILAVSSGEGISDIFKSLGKVEVLSGGQTMNPSTEDLVEAISNIRAKHVFILPNNSNIILSANQAAELAEQSVSVIPTKTIAQGIAATLAFKEDTEIKQNENEMQKAASSVKSSAVTFAVRDSSYNGIQIKEKDFIGLSEGNIITSGEELLNTCQQLLQHVVDVDQDEFITVFTGLDAEPVDTDNLIQYIEQQFPDLEIELHQGGQPLYYYMFSIE